MTTSEIISVAKGLYTNANIDNDYINKLNMVFNELFEIANVTTDSIKRNVLLQMIMDLKDSLESGFRSRSADIIFEFLATIEGEKRIEKDIDKEFNRKTLIDTFKENLKVLSKYNASLFIGLMNELYPEDCLIEGKISESDVEHVINEFSKYIDKYNGEFIDGKFVDHVDLDKIDEINRNSLYMNPERQYDFDLDYCGNKSIKIVEKDKIFFLPSGYDSNLEAQILFNDSNYQVDTAYVLVGLGNGSVLDYFLKHTNIDNEIICVEPDIEVFIKTMHFYKFTSQKERLRFYIFVNGINDRNLEGVFQSIVTPQRIPVTSIVTISSYYSNYYDEVQKFNARFQKAAKWNTMNLNTKVFRGANAVENIIENLPILIKNSSIYDCVTSMKSYKDRTAFIVGAGPSLDKNIDVLKRVKNKGIIIAADTAVKILLNHGIVPDMMVTIDAMKKKETFDDDRLNDIPILTGGEALNIAIKNHRSRIFFLTDLEYVRYFILKYDKPDIFFSTGGSVATSAMFFSYLVGFKRIVMVGMDLAMTKMKYHASDIYNEGTIDLNNPNIVECESYDGAKVYSTLDLVAYAEWIEESLSKFRDSEVINATEGGLKIKGVENVTLDYAASLVENELEVDFSKALAEVPITFTNEEIQEILEINASYVEFAKAQDRKLKLLISDLEHAKNEFEMGKKVDFTSLFDRIHEFDDSRRNDAFQALVSIKAKQKEKEIVDGVINFNKKAADDSTEELLEAVINMLKATLEANKEVGEKFSEVYKKV